MRTSLRVWLFLLFISALALALATYLPHRQLWLLAWVVVLSINIGIFWSPEWLIHRLKAEELLGHDPFGLLKAWDQFDHPQARLRFFQIPTEAPMLLVLGRSPDNAKVLLSENLLKSLSTKDLQLLVKALARWAHSPTLFPLSILTATGVILPNFLHRWMQKRLIDNDELLMLEKNLFATNPERTQWAHLLMRWNYQGLLSSQNLMLSKPCSSLLPVDSTHMECRIINLVSQFPPQR